MTDKEKPQKKQAKKQQKPQPKPKKETIRWYFWDIASFFLWKKEKAEKKETPDEIFAEFKKWDEAGRPEVTPEQLFKLKESFGGGKVFKNQIQTIMEKIVIELLIRPLFREDKEKKLWKTKSDEGAGQKKETPAVPKSPHIDEEIIYNPFGPKRKIYDGLGNPVRESSPKKGVAETKPVVVSSGFSLGRVMKTAPTPQKEKGRPAVNTEKKAELKEKWLESRRAKEMFMAASRDKCQGSF